MLKMSNYIKIILPIFSFCFLIAAPATAQYDDKEYFEYVEKLAVSDPFSAPNVHTLEGRNKYDYYGSGDVNNDEVINQEDADLIKNNQITSEMKDRADVNGDGVVNSADAGIIEAYLSGERNFLPGHWDKLNLQPNRRELKLDWLNKMLKIDKTDENSYQSNYYDCNQFTRQVKINFSGIEKFEEYMHKEFYENYGATNARFNIPVYAIGTRSKIEGYGDHSSCAVYLGPEEDSEKDDLFEKGMNEKQWYIFEPQSDQKKIFGDSNYNENGRADITGFSYNRYYDHYNSTSMVQFDLENGIAKLKKDMFLPNGGVGTILEYIDQGGNIFRVLENPWHLELNYKEKPTKITYETGTESYLKSGEIKEMEVGDSGDWESNTEYYQNRIKEKRTFSNFKNVNPIFNYYEYDYNQKDSVFFNVGRHNISDVREYLVEVRDSEAPVFVYANANGELPPVTIGEWRDKEAGANVTPENPNIGWPAVADSCPQIDMSWEATLIEEGEQQLVYQLKFTATDYAVEPNSSTARQQVTIDKTTFAEKPANENESFWVYPNPAGNSLQVHFKNPKTTEPPGFKIFTINGQPVENFIENAIQENTKLNVGHLQPGIYILQVSAGNTVLQKTFVKQ